MLKALSFGLGLGAGVQAWRNWPATALVSGDALAVVFCVGLVAAYFAGRWSSRHRGASATAVAVSSSESSAAAVSSASQHVNVAFVLPGAGAGQHAGGVAIPSESAPWIGSSSTAPALTSDHLEGFDLADILDSHPDRAYE